MKRVIVVNNLDDVVKGMNVNFDQIYATINQQHKANKWLRIFVILSAISIVTLTHDSSVLSTRTRIMAKEIDKLKEKLKELEGASKCD